MKDNMLAAELIYQPISCLWHFERSVALFHFMLALSCVVQIGSIFADLKFLSTLFSQSISGVHAIRYEGFPQIIPSQSHL